MSSLQVLIATIDMRLVTPTRLGEIVDQQSGGTASRVVSLIGSEAVAADPTEARRYIDFAGEKIEAVLEDRFLYRQRYRFRTAGSGRKRLALAQWPAEREGLIVANSSFDYRLNGEVDDSYLYRDSNWPPDGAGQVFTGDRVAGTESDSYSIDFTAGFVMPGQFSDWTADRDYIPDSSASVGGVSPDWAPDFGSWVRPSAPTANRLYFECVVAGTAAGAESIWPTATPWSTETIYAVGDWVLPPTSPIHLWYEVTDAGTSGPQGSEPDWPVVAGDEVVADGVTYTAREQLLFPEGPNTLVWAGHFTEVLSLTLQHKAALLAIDLAKLVTGQVCDDKKCEESAENFARSLRLAA